MERYRWRLALGAVALPPCVRVSFHKDDTSTMKDVTYIGDGKLYSKEYTEPEATATP